MGFKHQRQPSPESVTGPSRRHREQPQPDRVSRADRQDEQQRQDGFLWNLELVDEFKALEKQINEMRSNRGVWNSQSKKQLDTWIETINKCVKKLEAGNSTLNKVYEKAQSKKINVDQAAFQSMIEKQIGRLRRLKLDKIDKIDKIGNSNKLVNQYDTDVLFVSKISKEARKARSKYVDQLRDAMD